MNPFFRTALSHTSCTRTVFPGLSVTVASPLFKLTSTFSTPENFWRGETYYFCNPSCLEKFKADPARYVAGKKAESSPELHHDPVCGMDIAAEDAAGTVEHRVERARLNLRSRLAAAFREYQDGVAAAERYRGQMLPRAQEAYDLYVRSFRQMAAAYPQVIIAQRNLFQLQEDYISTLVSGWQRAVEIQGLLLTEGGEMSGHEGQTIAVGTFGQE